jgi:hypothetical protein
MDHGRIFDRCVQFEMERQNPQSPLQSVSLRLHHVWRYTLSMSRDFILHRTGVDVLDYEVVQEQASALGRMGRALEDALAALREFDAIHPPAEAPASAQPVRRHLVAKAGHALWMFVVQREACGLRDSRAIMREYKVPPEVQQCMGIIPAKPVRAAR